MGACIASFSCRTPSQDSLRNVVFFRRRLWRKNNEVVFSFFFFLLLLLLVVSRGTTTRPACSCRCRSIDRSISSERVANARLEDVRNDGYEYALSLSLFFGFFFPLSVLNNLIKIDVFKTTNKKKARCNKLTSLDVRDDDSPQNQGNFGMLQRER